MLKNASFTIGLCVMIWGFGGALLDWLANQRSDAPRWDIADDIKFGAWIGLGGLAMILAAVFLL